MRLEGRQRQRKPEARAAPRLGVAGVGVDRAERAVGGGRFQLVLAGVARQRGVVALDVELRGGCSRRECVCCRELAVCLHFELRSPHEPHANSARASLQHILIG